MTAMELAGSGSWSLGVLIGAPATVLVLLLSVAAIVAGLRWRGRPSDYGESWFLILGGAAVVLFTIVIAVWAFYPYSAQYHQWREASGTIAKIDKRLISDGDKGMSDKFVVRFTDGGQQFGCDDTRCAGIEVGDELTLSCKRAWQFTGTDGYDCRFVSTEPAR